MSNRILVVEDDRASQYIYRTLLTRAGYETEIHGEGLPALASAVKRPPRLMILDVGLPDIGGVELARRLRAQPATAKVPILVLTVYAFSEERNAALAAGADRFMSKPDDWSEVMEVIAQMAGPARAGDASDQAQ